MGFAMDFRFEKKDLVVSGGEPRVAAATLATALEMKRGRRGVSDIIDSNRAEIERHGPIAAEPHMVATGSGARRQVSEYLLNEPQALLVCMFSRTQRAADVRSALISVFMAWRRGQSSPVVLSAGSSTHRIRAAKMRFAEAATSLDALGVDVSAIDMNAVLAFGRAVLR